METKPESHKIITYREHKELWTGKESWVLRISCLDNSIYIFANGWHHAQLVEENSHRFKEGVPPINPPAEYTAIAKECERFELEISLDDAHNVEVGVYRVLRNTLEWLVGNENADEDAATMLNSVVGHEPPRVSARCAEILDVSGLLYHLDLPSLNMPSRNGDGTEPVVFVNRWARIFVFEHGTITLYAPLTGSQCGRLRWPHYGIWLNRDLKWFTHTHDVGTAKQAVNVICEYNLYNLRSCMYEETVWRDTLAGSLSVQALDDMHYQLETLFRFHKDVMMCVHTLETVVDTRLRDFMSMHRDAVSETSRAANVTATAAVNLLHNADVLRDNLTEDLRLLHEMKTMMRVC